MGKRPCALTCARAYHGCRKPAGESVSVAYGMPHRDDGWASLRHAVIRHIFASHCLEHVARWLPRAHSQRVVAHDVFHALRCAGDRLLDVPGFELRHGNNFLYLPICPNERGVRTLRTEIKYSG